VFDRLEDQGGEGFNHWYKVMLKEGRNRIVRRTFEALGLPVSRLMRVRFGLINLPPRLKRGMSAELGEGEVAQILDWVGIDTSVPEAPEPAKLPEVRRNSVRSDRAHKGARPDGSRPTGNRNDSRTGNTRPGGRAPRR